jgi:hypothetical protein
VGAQRHDAAALARIWDVSTASWTRSKDADGNYDLVQGSTVLVTGGGSYGNTYWLISTTGAINIGTTAIAWLRALASSISTASFLQSGAGAVARSAQDKMREGVSVFDFMTAAQVADVQAGTLLLDVSGAIRLAIASFPTTFDFNSGSFAGTVFFPPGKYYCASTIQINRQVVLKGAGNPAGNAFGISQILFADNISGFVINTNGHPSGGSLDATGAMLDSLYIGRSVSAGGTLGHGVDMQARAEIRNCLIDSFRQNGINIVADAGASGTNANMWRIENTRSMRNGGHGFYAQGGDSNAGSAVGLDCSSNGGSGIYDSSFLGNTFIGCHVTASGAAAYKTDNLNSSSVFVGCYEEGGYTASSFTESTAVVGGPLAATAPSGQRFGSLKISTGTSVKGNATLTFGDKQNVNHTAFSITSNDEPAFPWRMTYATGAWSWRWADAVSWFQLYNSQTTVANGYARDLSAAGGIGFPLGYYAGGSGLLKLRTVAAAAPVAGTYLQGDIVYNSAPASGGFIGWVCTAGGTPGTWKTFGVIS